MSAVEFWFEFASSYSYPAAMRIGALAAQYGRTVAWRPFLLGPIFMEQGWNDSPFNLYAAKGRYMWRDLERQCAELGLPLQRPSQFPRHSVLAASIACAVQDPPWLPEYVRRVYVANFVHDRDIAGPEVLKDCLHGLTPDADDVIARAQTPQVRATLRAQVQQAQALGIFGAPSFVVDGDLFWGNERMETALRWGRAAHPREE